MSAPETAGETREMAPPPRRRRRGCLTFVLVVSVFVFGMICGSGLTVFGVVRHVRRDMANPDRRPQRATRHIARKLDLTPEQEEKVRAILLEQHKEFRQLRREAGPRIVRRMVETDRAIREVLTPTQERQWRALVERWKRQWLPEDMQGKMREKGQ